MVPVTAVAVVAGAGVLGPVVADASPDLPELTAQELLARVQTAKVDGLSGTVRSVADLGLPALPTAPGQGEGDRPGGDRGNGLSDLLSGEHTARVAFAGPDKARVSVLDDLAERVWTTDGTTAWAYDSTRREAVRLAVPERPTTQPEREAYDPQAAARKFLGAVDPSTKVEVTGTESVAGRDAYRLRLEPRTDRTTVGSVTLAVDSETWVPLEVTVMPRTGDDPAVQLGYSAVSFDTPAASSFVFTPPQGVKVTEKKLPTHKPNAAPGMPRKKPATQQPTVVGTGWDRVVVVRGAKSLPTDGPLGQLLANARTVQGTWGSGKLLTSKMISALVTDDGRVLTGLVTADTLVEAAAKAPR